MNYFEIFELREEFDLNKKLLLSKYLDLQKLHHPDKDKGSSISADLNKAYQVLKDDLARAEYLLKIKGLESLPALSADKLHQVIDDNEKIEVYSDREDIEKMLEEKLESLKLLKEDMASFFKSNSIAESSAICTEIKYQLRIIENIKLKLKTLL